MEIHYQEYGDENASLVVFLHGGGVSSWMWDKQIRYFTHYYCLTIDLPEHGKSNELKPFSIKSSAERITSLIEETAAGKEIIVVGFSLGAQVSIQMLSMKPNLIDYAIINSALVRPSPFTLKLIRPSIKLSHPLVKNKFFSKLQAKTLYIGKEYFNSYYEESSAMKSGSLIRILEENMSFKIPVGFNRAKAKILVTVGEQEKGMMKKSAEDITISHSNCTGIIIPNVGHGISLASPEFFNHLVESWLEGGTLPEDAKVIS